MHAFPWVDPIPLPAPVWLFKSLHIVTLSLHFIAVKMLLGGLTAAVILNLLGKTNPVYQGASAVLARRLPVVMTYVINLGVPPLLFAQVLYGPALYTSNVLIGVFWFSIVFLLMACYWCLYRFSDGVQAGKNMWIAGVIACLLAGCISRIFSTNMAVMIKPEVWPQMYAASALGNHLPPFDPTLTPRWMVMLFGAGWVCGFWLIWLAGRKSIEQSVKVFMAGLGAKLAAVFVICQAFQFYTLIKLQPSSVIQGIQSSPLLKTALYGWYILSIAVFLIAAWAFLKKPCHYLAGYVVALVALLSVLDWVIIRDGIRDLTLNANGFDVWQQVVVTNWQVVIVFLLTFVLGIAALVWLISVMMRAKPLVEGRTA